MNYNPISAVTDESLPVDSQLIEKLAELKKTEKFNDLPGANADEERIRLSAVLDELLDVLITGLMSHPSKLWVMKQFQRVLETVENEDTEARELFGTYLEQIMDILEIESSDGLLSFYL